MVIQVKQKRKNTLELIVVNLTFFKQFNQTLCLTTYISLFKYLRILTIHEAKYQLLWPHSVRRLTQLYGYELLTSFITH